MRALSLGTGLVPQGMTSSYISNPLDWGVIYWMWPFASSPVPDMALMNLVMDCTSRAATAEAQNFLSSNFCRGNIPMKEVIELDDWEQADKFELAPKNSLPRVTYN